MRTLDVDLLVIGWGKAGKTLAGVVGRTGKRVALVERSREMYGGSCINVACVPTKALIHHASERRDGDAPSEWFAASVDERDALINKLNAKNHEMLETVDTVTLVDGHARFVGSHEVEVSVGDDSLRVTAETIVINTGTEPARPDIPGADGATVHGSTTLQHVDPLPRRLVIVGAGYVGDAMATKSQDERFTDEERAAMKERAAEIKKAKKRGTGSKKTEADAQDCRDTIAAMPDGERAIGELLQEVVSEVAPDLLSRTWYGMPAWTREGQVVVFFKHASKFKMRYSEVGFQEAANLDDGDIWPTVFGVTSASAAVRKKLEAEITKAVS